MKNILRVLVISGMMYAAVGYAENSKTQLEMNQYVFQMTEDTGRDMRPIDYFGTMVLLRPLDVVKQSTEEMLLLKRAEIIHDADMQRDVRDTIRPYTLNTHESAKTDGPKIRLTF